MEANGLNAEEQAVINILYGRKPVYSLCDVA